MHIYLTIPTWFYRSIFTSLFLRHQWCARLAELGVTCYVYRRSVVWVGGIKVLCRRWVCYEESAHWSFRLQTVHLLCSYLHGSTDDRWCARLAGLRCSLEGGSDMKNWLTGPADRWVLSLIPGYMTMIGDSVFAIAMNNDLTVPADSWLWTLIAAYTYLWMVHSVLRFTLLFLSPLHRSVVRVGWIKVLCRRSYVTPVATYMVLQTGSTYNGVFTIEIYLAVPTLFYRPVMICSDDLFTIDIYRVVPIPFYNDTYGIHIYLVVSIPIYRLPVFYTAGLCYSVDGSFTMSNELTFPTDCRCAQLRTQCLSIDVLDHSVDGGSTVRFHFAVLTDCWCLR
ncbi:hypothetical protein M422DRAFT_54893 [Sphaerobolus stellatus SS14]|uniref:Uncharacterized protein n=1 Tax=Sphaerobolus stellatus (strain SS14) TaxID=990650 RepID=A0A0C9UR89_SPHS4|nr:hypothetical protein M422DRAFT_54893 [Sphaerobolus stellatus SS14]